MQRIHDQHFMQSTLKKSRSGIAIRVFDVRHTELVLISNRMQYADGKHYGIDVAHIEKPRELSLREIGSRARKLGRPSAVWLFENDNWNISAMLTFVKNVHSKLRPDDIYKGTSLGRHNNEIAFQARVLKEGFAGTGLKVHAPAVVAWTPEALLHYAEWIHVALKSLGDYQQKLSA
jgi:hypothetical protein